jgi:hypothetical protein
MSDRKDLIHTLKHNYNAKREYNTFLPGFIIGAFVAIRAKIYLAEPSFARPWTTIFCGLAMGSLFHYWVNIN